MLQYIAGHSHRPFAHQNPANITRSFVHSVKLFVTHFIADFIAGSLHCLYRRHMESRPGRQTGLIRLLIFDVLERTSSVPVWQFDHASSHVTMVTSRHYGDVVQSADAPAAVAVALGDHVTTCTATSNQLYVTPQSMTRSYCADDGQLRSNDVMKMTKCADGHHTLR